MEETGVKEILNALKSYSGDIDKKMDQMKIDLENRMDERFDRVDERLDRLKTKSDSLRVELTETQETVDFLSSKNVQHEKKLRNVSGQ
ncbi:hypothetical protein ACUL41_05045 [Virgibacillus natechei]|uniref:hypothetical protein n=1 Tax=Virgibacillus sp. CBA3643 TaxID=2942278 RepID=UPI0035A3D458